MSKVKLTEKEISALAKKVSEKKKAERSATIAAEAKKKLPEAKKYIELLNSLPAVVQNYVYNSGWKRSQLSPTEMAKVLVTSESPDYNSSYRDEDLKTIEADVILQAHDCSSLTQLCKKLGI